MIEIKRNPKIKTFLIIYILFTLTYIFIRNRKNKNNFLNTFKNLNKEKNDDFSIYMMITNKTDVNFYQNSWFWNKLKFVCDFKENEHCDVICGFDSTYNTIEKKMKCMLKAMKNDENKIVMKLDDDAWLNRIETIIFFNKIYNSTNPIYSGLIGKSNDKKLKEDFNFAVGWGYILNDLTVECALNSDINITGINEDIALGYMIHKSCSNVEYINCIGKYTIWHQNYNKLNKKIILNNLSNHCKSDECDKKNSI